MGKTLVLIGLIGLCLAFTDKPQTFEYTPAAVNSTRVLEQANYALRESAKEFSLRCKDAVLVQVTRAKHKLDDRPPFYGALYLIDMIIRTSKVNNFDK
ncbi:hypothetical protein CHS0354_018102 [Potamilus streckersoni]|uniref:Cystatin domain-containing protein n=1 Tax=Potamilus streckersoni TaxID=2493646 RepID=A0AAE0TJG3_9BIVA|nr:hypothetical protein CHS0354_018102 [Potamilus streckersoni]